MKALSSARRDTAPSSASDNPYPSPASCPGPGRALAVHVGALAPGAMIFYGRAPRSSAPSASHASASRPLTCPRGPQTWHLPGTRHTPGQRPARSLRKDTRRTREMHIPPIQPHDARASAQARKLEEREERPWSQARECRRNQQENMRAIHRTPFLGTTRARAAAELVIDGFGCLVNRITQRGPSVYETEGPRGLAATDSPITRLTCVAEPTAGARNPPKAPTARLF